MILSRAVAYYVEEHGRGTAEEIARIYPQLSRHQIRRALDNACISGWIYRKGVAPRRDGVERGRMPAVYYPGPNPTPPPPPPPKPVVIVRPPNSAWELGQTLTGDWPPAGEGRHSCF